MIQDRASIARTHIIAVIAEALRAWLHGEDGFAEEVHGQIDQYLRDQFLEVAQQTMNETRLPE